MKIVPLSRYQALVRVQTTLRLSKNYQSSENLVGIDIPCENNTEAIKAAFEKGWQFVDAQLVVRTKESKDALDMLGK